MKLSIKRPAFFGRNESDS